MLMRFVAASLLALSAGAAQAYTYCPSNHGTGFVEFWPESGQAHLVLTGRGEFQGGVPVDLQLNCIRDTTSERGEWGCEEPAPYRNPDGQTKLGIETSYEYFLMVATRVSSSYRGEIGVDDFTCYQ